MPVYKTVSSTTVETLIETAIAGIGVTPPKIVKNNTGATLPINSVVSWQPDGSVALASASSLSGLADFAGITLVAIVAGGTGQVIQSGILPGIMTGMGAVPGQEVYLSATPGQLTLTPASEPTDTILRIGTAEPASGGLSGAVTDLRFELDIVSEV